MVKSSSNLQKEHDKLKKQVQDTTKELEDLRSKVQSAGIMASSSTGMEQGSPQDLDKSIKFLSEEYDDLKAFQTAFEKDYKRISSKLEAIEESILKIDEAIEEIHRYSYQYNLKILGVKQEKRYETAKDTVDICLKLFNELGATINEQDIDIAHRLPTRRDSNFPPTIVCKFTRRIAKESVILCRKRIPDLDLTRIGLPNSDVNNIKIFDHLTPKTQLLFNKAKSFKKDHGYAYCWTKNSTVLLRESDSSSIIRVTGMDVLEKLADQSDHYQEAGQTKRPPWRRLWPPPEVTTENTQCTNRPRTRSTTAQKRDE